MDWASLISAGIQATSQAAQGILNYNENIKNRNLQKYLNERNYQAQKEFYQNSIRWRKADALAAGINPIYALGGSSASFTPSFQASDYQPINVSKFGDIAQQFNAARQAQEQIDLAKEAAKTENKLNEARIATEEAKQAHLTAQTSKILENETTSTAANAPAAVNKVNNLLKNTQKPKKQIDFLNEILDPRKKAVVYANANGSYSIVYDDQSIRGQLYSEQQPGLLASAIPGGGYIADRIDMNRMSWELKDEYEKVARELEKQNPGKYAYIQYNTKSGIWEIHLKDNANTMKDNLRNRLREKGASEKYIRSIK